MPELVEVEIYRRSAERALGRRIDTVDAPDEWFCKRTTTPDRLRAELPGCIVSGTRRIGKHLLLDLTGPSGDTTLGLRFGMTGRLIVDGGADIDELLYSSGRDEPAWDRFAMTFDDGGTLAVRDPRRLGGVEIDPESAPDFALGPDAASVTRAQFRAALASARGPVKAVLLDQSRVAGVGNLIVDEVLWRAGIAPTRPVPMLDDAELQTLRSTLVKTIALLQRRGGSHLGDLVVHRDRDGRCPRDGAALARGVVGGRTTYWCPLHQR